MKIKGAKMILPQILWVQNQSSCTKTSKVLALVNIIGISNVFQCFFFYFAGHKFLCSSINLEMRPNVMRLSGKKNPPGQFLYTTTDAILQVEERRSTEKSYKRFEFCFPCTCKSNNLS